jgi:hypothetical protein
MNDQLDRAVRSVLTDIISTAPSRDDQPIRTVGVVETPSRAGRPYLMVATAALAVVGVGGVALVNGRDTGRAPASATPTSVPSAVATSTPDTSVTTAPTPVPEGPMADLFQQVAYRVGSGEASLAALGFPNNEYSIDGDGVTTVLASDPSRPNERRITIVMTPGTMLQPEDHSRTAVTVVAQTSTLIRVENHSNDGWTFSVEFVDTGGGPLPAVEQLQDLIYSIDP